MARVYDLDEAVSYVARLFDKDFATDPEKQRMVSEQRAVQAIRGGFHTTQRKAEELFYDALAAGKLMEFKSSIGGSYLYQLKLNDSGTHHRFMWVKPDAFESGGSHGHFLDREGVFSKTRVSNHAAEDSEWVILPDLWETLSEGLKAGHEAIQREAAAKYRAKQKTIHERHGEDLGYIRGLFAAIGMTESHEVTAHLSDKDGTISVHLSFLKDDQITKLANVLKEAGIKPVDLKVRKS